MSDKTVEEIANEIWQKGYNAGRAAAKELYQRGYQEALHELSQWSGPADNEPPPPPDETRYLQHVWIRPATADEALAAMRQADEENQDNSDLAPVRTRVLEWLRRRPDGASPREFTESGVSRDNAALWRLKRSGDARQDPETGRYYWVDKSNAKPKARSE